MDKETFRNTAIGDILESWNVWHYPSNFKVQSRPGISDTENEKKAGPQDGSEEENFHVSYSECPNIETPLDECPCRSNPECQSSEASLSDNDSFLVDWNGPDDYENPHNWSYSKKSAQIAYIMLLSIVTFAGSAIYTPGQTAIQKDFHIGQIAATLPLSIFVLGYGIGQLFFSPMSELSRIGRVRIYIITSALFAIFQIGCATVKNIGGMIALRFITGVLASPTLSTGGATMSDMISPNNLLLAIGAWTDAATAAPSIAPLVGAALLVSVNWTFIFWFLTIVISALAIFAFLFLAESSHANILHRRANRIRKETHDNRYYTLEEKKERETKLGDFLFEIAFRPLIIQFSEPGVLAFNIHTSVTYGALYLFFESCPIVFTEMYHFSIIEYGCAFLGFFIGCVSGYIGLVIFKYYVMAPSIKAGTFTPEVMLRLSLPVALIFPASLLFFGWTAQVHWILPIIGEPFFTVSIYLIFQGIFGYFSLSYPRYVASVFASNGFMRSAFACAFPIFGTAMFKGLATKKNPVGWGCTLVAFVALGLGIMSFIFYRISPKLRARSKYAN